MATERSLRVIQWIGVAALVALFTLFAFPQTQSPCRTPDPNAAEVKEKRERADKLARAAFSPMRQSPNELRESIRKADEARVLFAELCDRERQAELLRDSAEAYSTLGEYRKTLALYRSIQQLMGNENAEIVIGVLMGIGEAQYNLGEMQAALETQLEALRQVGVLKIPEAESIARAFVGKAYSGLGQKTKAIEFYLQALRLIEKSGSSVGKEQVMTLLGDAYLDLGETERAQNYYQAVLQLYKGRSSPFREALVRTYIANAFAAAGDRRRAAENYEQALGLMSGNPMGESIVLNAFGLFYVNAGDRVRAKDLFLKASSRSAENGNEHLSAIYINNLGLVNSATGEYSAAIDNFTTALKIADKVGDTQLLAMTSINFGFLYSSLGENRKAVEQYSAALAAMEAIGNRKGQAVALNNLGLAYSLLGEQDQAVKMYTQAGELDRSFQDVLRNNIGGVFLVSKDNQNAIEQFSKALASSRVSGDRNAEAVSLQNLGAALDRLGDHTKAIEMFDQALGLQRASGDARGVALTLNNLMTAWRALDRPRLAVFYGKQAVNDLQTLRGGIRVLDTEIQKSFLSSVSMVYRNLAELLIREGRIPEAEQVIRMLKEEEYFEFINRDGAAVASLDQRAEFDVDEQAALDKFENAFAELDRARRKAERATIDVATASAAEQAQLTAAASAAKTEAEAAAVRSKAVTDQIVADLSRKPSLRPTTGPGTRAIVKAWNEPGTALVSYVVGSGSLGIIITTDRSQKGFVRPVTEERLRSLFGDFRAAVTAGNNADAASQALYDELIRPIERDLEASRIKTVVWSLDKFLRYVPMAALKDRAKGYVAQRYASVVLALASRQDLAVRPGNKAGWRALGVGVSEGLANMAPLANVPAELTSIVRDPGDNPSQHGLMAGKRLLNKDFTLANFRTALASGYPVAHAASHFVFIPGTKAEGLNSYLLLGSGQRLTLAQLQASNNFFSGVELLTLSACDTGYGGATADGREIEGLGVLAQRKGARAIMASLWPVDDESTRYFMVEFYRDYLKPGVSKAEAMRRAQLALLGAPDLAARTNARGPAAMPMGRFASPYFWSPFILIGNWH